MKTEDLMIGSCFISGGRVFKVIRRARNHIMAVENSSGKEFMFPFGIQVTALAKENENERQCAGG